MTKFISILFLIAVMIGFFSSNNLVNSQHSETKCCTYWQAKIDESLGKSPLWGEPFDKLSDEEIMTAIECLLKLEGNQNEANFSGAINPYVSGVPQFTPVEVSALYYISYLYYKKSDHANIVALRDGSGEFSTPSAIKEAYASYKKWFEEVKKIGLAKAREQKLDPLAYTKVKWY